MKLQQTTIIFLSLLLAATCSFAQNARFPFSGVIEYEKSINMFAMMKKNMNESSGSFWRDMYDNYKRSQPQFKILKSTLAFSTNKTVFTPIADTEAQRGFFFGNDPIVSQNNTIHTDFATGMFTAQKTVYEETFLLKDTIRQINWKLTSEMRTIAGYECRRANAIILDSIYVVAFYTDKIPVSGGPESFTGLPGMILGVALPHENITWFAKTVTDKSVSTAEMKIPSKGKAATYKSLKETINSALKDWGDHAKSALKAFSL
ncbi:GLPGLI family protein [Pedobacter frigoris]|uniref:GLPGLI family protein n=1 Tax=Pedobacter frigoris TaxID=2571272 RepID=A0A4U1CL93_9SPHI|nr:GLPGLI family protein [Pedobacter frigoris]TKC07632.1 GLPGLI family protein [Pedobacter frigoris]